MKKQRPKFRFPKPNVKFGIKVIWHQRKRKSGLLSPKPVPIADYLTTIPYIFLDLLYVDIRQVESFSIALGSPELIKKSAEIEITIWEIT